MKPIPSLSLHFLVVEVPSGFARLLFGLLGTRVGSSGSRFRGLVLFLLLGELAIGVSAPVSALPRW